MKLKKRKRYHWTSCSKETNWYNLDQKKGSESRRKKPKGAKEGKVDPITQKIGTKAKLYLENETVSIGIEEQYLVRNSGNLIQSLLQLFMFLTSHILYQPTKLIIFWDSWDKIISPCFFLFLKKMADSSVQKKSQKKCNWASNLWNFLNKF